MEITCVSDLHGHYPKLEGGDLLIVAGDLTATDNFLECVDFVVWLTMAKYRKKIVIGGNHDNLFVKNPPNENTFGDDCSYLCDSGTEFEGLKIWGSPYTKRFPGQNPNAMAFTVDTEDELAEKWALIPDDTDILVTHCPPYGILDRVDFSEGDSSVILVGCKNLLIRDCIVRSKLHVFGHIHESYGKDFYQFERFCGTGEIIFVNASHVNERYEPVNKPIRIEL